MKDNFMKLNHFTSIIMMVFISQFFLFGGQLMAMNIPTEVKSVVAFLFIESDGKLIANGTGFFIGVQDQANAESSFIYLVTAKHVLVDQQTKQFYNRIFIRLNKKDGKSGIEEIPLNINYPNKTIFISDDESVDIALIPCLPNQQIYDFKFLPSEMITTKQDFSLLGIKEGSDVFFPGMFTSYLGELKNYPIVRFGKVALVTDERIDFNGNKSNVYIIELNIFGGNSGAPLFFYLGMDRDPNSLVVGPPILKLAGIVLGYFNAAQEIKIIETNQTPVAYSNLGIAAVAPAYELHSILYSAEVRKLRGEH